MKINEIFVSIQGEGQFTGTPSVFIRFHGCPVQCEWCDTPWTWYAFDNNKVLLHNLLEDDNENHCWAESTVNELLDTIKRMCTGIQVSHFVLTGGEPLLYLSDIKILLPRLYEIGAKSVQIETSGAVQLEKRDFDWFNCWLRWRPGLHITCSPKHIAIQPEFENIVSEWKLPIESPVQQSTPIHMGKLMGRNIYLQPVNYGIDKERSENAVSNAVELCKRYGFKLSLQTHKFIGVR